MSRRSFLAVAAVLLLSGCASTSNSAHVQGTVLATDGRTWLVGKNLVVLPPALQPDGPATLGADVSVDGSWGPSGQLVATSVQVVQPALAPTPAPTLAPTQPSTQPGQPAAKGKPRGGRDKD